MGYTKPEKTDIPTKALGRIRFQEPRDKIGIMETSSFDKVEEEIVGSNLVSEAWLQRQQQLACNGSSSYYSAMK